ncbi:VQ motif-containing protein [Quillaja saponaria]|uniref:VQ motif-containing protein n=1 Tax=Quillaja saponaria TaxID=32244 RepID=A0AAD7LW23_QUISA|nr:VQ motif-containing protein [Quillaja saponaria]
MDFQDINPCGKSPRRELQGPRPTPLKIHKDSHKIKKPPLAPQPAATASQQAHPPPRQPVIIYTVSPKIIHTTPNDFMNLVQRLTGSTSSSSSYSNPLNHDGDGAISPAARYAAIEKTRSPPEEKKQQQQYQQQHMEGIETMSSHGLMERGMNRGMQGMGMFHGILSPGPASLSPIPTSFFSPPSSSDPGSFSSFFHDLSPVLHGNRNFLEGSYMPSPSTIFVSPHMTSPTPSIDLFNNFSDYNQ